MQLGMIGLGKMGANMRERLRKAGHEVVGYDLNPEVRDVDTLEALVTSLEAPRVVERPEVIDSCGCAENGSAGRSCALLYPSRPVFSRDR